MFESLSEKLNGVFDTLRGKASITPDDVDMAAREIRTALLEADVALPVVKDFIAQVKEKAIGAAVTKSVTPGQQIVKIVHDAMVDMLRGEGGEDNLTFGAAPSAYLMVGLQGAGKTTSTAKIAKFLTDKHRKKVLMASLDTSRPAAQEQLKILGQQTEIATLPIIAGQSPLEITARAMEMGRKESFDVVMLDTAGRLSIDDALMDEVRAVSKAANPVETLLVVDAMSGQDALGVAQNFDDKIGISGIIMTRIDGDARGGAAMSMRAVTGKPIKLLGTGERWDALEPFHPERIAGRILGMGDIVTLVEKASEHVAEDDAKRMAEKLKKGQFDFNDLLTQIRQMNKMGGLGAMAKLMPGLGKMANAMENAGVDESMIKTQEAMILSMTPAERENPKLMNASRKKRIAAGSGVQVQDVNKLCKQQQGMQTMMKRIKKMGMGGMLKQMMGGKADDMAMMADTMDPDGLGADMAAMEHEPTAPVLGANPFAGSGMPAGLPGLGAGAGSDPMGMMGMQGMVKRGGSKKNRKPKNKKGRRK